MFSWIFFPVFGSIGKLSKTVQCFHKHIDEEIMDDLFHFFQFMSGSDM